MTTSRTLCTKVVAIALSLVMALYCLPGQALADEIEQLSQEPDVEAVQDVTTSQDEAASDEGLQPQTGEEGEGNPSEAATSIAAAQVAAADVTYTGSACTPAVTVTLEGTTLTEGADYSVSFANNVNVGTATVAVTGAGSYEGTATGTFAITPASIAAAQVSLSGTYLVYAGKAVKPAVTATFGGTTLTSGTDYAVTYKNNAKPGKASVTVTGTGNFTGSVTKTFYLARVGYKASLSKWGAVTYDGKTSGYASSGSKSVKKVSLNASGVSGSIKYRVYNTKGWSGWKSNGATASKKSKAISALQIKLTGTLADKYDVYYRVWTKTLGWQGWTKNGSSAGTKGMGVSIRGYQVVLVKKGAAAPGSTSNAYKVETAESTGTGAKASMTAKAQEFSSKTRYLVLVSTTYNYTAVFKGSKGNWSLYKFFRCSTGKKSTPTVKGSYTIKAHGNNFTTSNGKGTCWYYSQFYGNYLFHSVIYKYKSKTALYAKNQLGKNCSHGCVRLSLGNAKWIYDNIPSGTKVYVYGRV